MMATDRLDLPRQGPPALPGTTPLDGSARDSDASEKLDEARMNKWSWGAGYRRCCWWRLGRVQPPSN